MVDQLYNNNNILHFTLNVPKDCPNHERGIQSFKMNSLLASALMPTLFLWPLNVKNFVCLEVNICRLFRFCHSKLKSSQLYSLCKSIVCLYSMRFSGVALMLSLCKSIKEIRSQFCFEHAECNFCLRVVLREGIDTVQDFEGPDPG